MRGIVYDRAVQRGTRAAYEGVRQAIVEGTYEPGRRLVEQRIAEDFDVSRTPVREALRMLEAEGLVTSEPNRGAAVRAFSTEEIVDVYELRARLESYAAELAALRASHEQMAEITNAAKTFSVAVPDATRGDLAGIRALNRANERFHGALLDAAGHVRLGGVLARTVDVPLVFRAFQRFDRAELRRSALFHGLIAEAVAAGDGDRAGRLMTEHVLQGRDALLANMA